MKMNMRLHMSAGKKWKMVNLSHSGIQMKVNIFHRQRITKFEDGKTYMYSIELREKDGYKFSLINVMYI